MYFKFHNSFFYFHKIQSCIWLSSLIPQNEICLFDFKWEKLIHIWLNWLYVSSSIPEQGSKMLFLLHFFSYLWSQENFTTLEWYSSVCHSLLDWFISCRCHDFDKERFLQQGFWCEHSKITAFLKIINTLVLCFECLLLGNSSWDLTESKILEAQLNHLGLYYKG